ncbi:ribonuclease HI [Candidatus Saccharibacteria bacterium]|nr:ribonuclease HI [Candidatus Saccharibacteria bacterium]MBQ6149432.1 ribonuclease HI [Candidatus Saccharibacteria bacterium]
MKTFYTDGSASPNPGPGGWAIIDVNTKRPVKTGADKNTTNIRMEGTALINAIKCAGGEPVEIRTDSEFWINVVTKWAPAWKKRGWKKREGEIKNLDLVQKLYELYQSHDIKLVWVKGHAGEELNELADRAANEARKLL